MTDKAMGEMGDKERAAELGAAERGAAEREAAELEAQIAAVRAEREALERKGQEQDKATRLREELEQEKAALRDARTIEEAVRKHGPLGKMVEAVKTDAGLFIVRRPNHMHFQRYLDKGDQKTHDVEELVRPCLVYPGWSQFKTMVETLPAVLVKAGNAVARLAGFTREDVAGK